MRQLSRRASLKRNDDLYERHYARRRVEPEPGYEDGRNSKRCACTERGIGTGLNYPLTVTVRLREAMTELSRRASFV